MSTIFESDFTTANFADWTNASLSKGTPYPSLGCDNGPSVACMSGNISEDIASPDGSGAHSIYIRFQYAILASEDFSGLLPFVVAFSDTVTIYDGAGLFSGQLAILNDGTLVLGITAGASPTSPPTPGTFITPATQTFSSSSGIFPIDGTNHAIQVNLTFPDTLSVNYEIKVDNSTVISGNVAAGNGYCSSSWGHFNVGSYAARTACAAGYTQVARVATVAFSVMRDPACGTSLAHSKLSEVSITDTASSYPACTTPDLVDTICNAVINSMTVDCNTNQITFTGINFPDSMTIDLQGPSGIEETFDVISQTSTEMVIGNLNPPFFPGGKYCVTGPCV